MAETGRHRHPCIAKEGRPRRGRPVVIEPNRPRYRWQAGHGIEMEGVNYLVPVDACLAFDLDGRFETVTVDDLLVCRRPSEGSKS